MPTYTERPAFLQVFQIILTTIVLSLICYSFFSDLSWNNLVDKHKTVRTCTFLLFQVDKAAYNQTVQQIIDNVSIYPVPGPDPTDLLSKNDIEFFKREIYRRAPQESTALALMCITLLLLILHLFTACYSSDYEYRTKWTAAAQGVIIFLAGFAGIFLPISAYSLDEKYETIGDKFKECKILQLCRHDNSNNTFSKFLSENGKLNRSLTRDRFKKVFEENNVCQHFFMKIGAGVLCGIIVIVGCIIICSAMDLTTIYDDEDVDEEELARRDTYRVRHVKRSSKTKALETKARLSIVSLINRPSMAVLPHLNQRRVSFPEIGLAGMMSNKPNQLPEPVAIGPTGTKSEPLLPQKSLPATVVGPQPSGPLVDVGPHHKHHGNKAKTSRK